MKNLIIIILLSFLTQITFAWGPNFNTQETKLSKEEYLKTYRYNKFEENFNKNKCEILYGNISSKLDANNYEVTYESPRKKGIKCAHINFSTGLCTYKAILESHKRKFEYTGRISGGIIVKNLGLTQVTLDNGFNIKVEKFLESLKCKKIYDEYRKNK